MLTDEEFRLFRALIHEESAIYLKDERRSFLQDRIGKRLKATGIRSPYRYYKFLTDAEEGKEELLALLDILTINETSFFRNPPQFELFQREILPEVIATKVAAGDRQLKIWSAACSTGQEPYSIAMVTAEVLGPELGIPFLLGNLDILARRSEDPPAPLRGNWQVQIIASDISLTVLQAAQKGSYSERHMEGVSNYYRLKYFVKKDTQYEVKQSLKKMVAFDFHNLKHDNGLTNLDIIFCRNVMIYFDRPQQIHLIERLHRTLRPGGYLFLGHAETLHGLSDKFKFIYNNKATAYRKIED